MHTDNNYAKPLPLIGHLKDDEKRHKLLKMDLHFPISWCGLILFPVNQFSILFDELLSQTN